ncbi:hypothetical protein BGZ96_003278, partial [Linnemannia gamsii]
MSKSVNSLLGDTSNSDIPGLMVTDFCIIEGDTKLDSFPIDIHTSQTVGHLKQLIKEANPNTLRDIDARKLRIWCIIDPHAYSCYSAAYIDLKKIVRK